MFYLFKHACISYIPFPNLTQRTFARSSACTSNNQLSNMMWCAMCDVRCTQGVLHRKRVVVGTGQAITTPSRGGRWRTC